MLLGLHKIALIFSFTIGTSQLYAATPCTNGFSAGFGCKKLNLASTINLARSGMYAQYGNDVWGWVDPMTQKEYAVMGLSSKTAFVDVTDPENPVHIAELPTATKSILWRDVKVFKDHAFIVSEAKDHGMQVFDLRRLRDIEDMPARVTADTHYTQFGSAHNIFINEDSGYAYAVGSDTCDAGMHVMDVSNPVMPIFTTCIDKAIFEDPATAAPKTEEITLAQKHGEDYTHDVQCVMYSGPDQDYQGKEICFCSNADTVNLVDVTNKAQPVQIIAKRYSGLGYTHQGWLTEDQSYFILGDELDEEKYGHPTKTIIWDVRDLDNPVVIGRYFSRKYSIDHNMYVKGNLLYQANYNAGMRILDLSDVSNGNLSEVAYFDTMPYTDRAVFTGAWSLYPYFPSKNIVISNIDGRLFVITPDDQIAGQ